MKARSIRRRMFSIRCQKFRRAKINEASGQVGEQKLSPLAPLKMALCFIVIYLLAFKLPGGKT